MNNSRPDRRSPLALFPGQPTASRDCPDWPVGLKLGGKLLGPQEVVRTKPLPPRLAASGFVLGRPGPALSRSAET